MERHVFRIWDKRRGKMSEHFDIWSVDRDDSFNTYIPGLGKVYESDAVLMQCTSLIDRNGKLIFDGDIDKSGMVVTYCADQNDGLGMNAGWYLQRGDFESWTPLESRHNDNGDNWEIIGNIYENPELLT